MLQLRKSNERGYFDFGWLKTYHSFSFGDYYDPKHMHFESLRVINHDFIAAGAGFPTHPHRDMEILTYVLKGTVAHKDSMGNETTIKAGETQIMSAGTGIQHSEFNPSASNELELLQIWIQPKSRGITPRYGQFFFSEESKLNTWCLLANSKGGDKVIQIFQDIEIYSSILENTRTLNMRVSGPTWVQIATGRLKVNNVNLESGDGLAVQNVSELEFSGVDRCEFLLFHFPKNES